MAGLTLAMIAQRLHFQGPSERGETIKREPAVNHSLKAVDRDIANRSAFDADDVMVRIEIAIVTRAVMQERDLARLADRAQGFQRSMHCRQ